MTGQTELSGLDTTPDETLVGRDLADIPESKWAPLLAQLVGVLEAMYRRQGRGEDAALRLACDSVLAIAEYAGGRVMYLPRGDRLRTAVRDAEIHSRWSRGVTIEQLAADYRLSDIHVYRIIGQQRALHLRKIQGRLFGD